eukprot:Plantae.Rhodophyta-Rhodochaete_pulchella.ctg3414.p2 GENE.Plantae.Rhodophyta-Rhodochaete_pulchella.ctg3414~~Plantae.Rhodophyta-Rhodochaete_pulchella.ctg3414.p2  ORF type:complete len:460 (-),score=59.91 Plantae.Rhodophyta-Rhodochaete_pulchella.ctg3414:2930-4285(-)
MAVLRQETTYRPNDDRFRIDKPTFGQQYSQIYFCRLNALRPVVSEAARAKWASEGLAEDAYPDRLLGLGADRDRVVVGILFRAMPLKPSILKEYAKQGGEMIPAPPKRDAASYIGDGMTDQENFTVLEDETGRIKLDLSPCEEAQGIVQGMVTGFIVAVRGIVATGGVLSVKGICGAGLPTFDTIPTTVLEKDAFVCLVSGLHLADPAVNPLALEMLLEYLNGNLGDSDHEQFCASIVRVVFAGNSIGALRNPAADTENAHIIKGLDRFLTALGAAIHLDIMPGDSDPTNILLPQQPFNRSLLPSASRFKNLRRTPNPYEADIGERRFTGTSGQNVADYDKYQVLDSNMPAAQRALLILENMLQFRHIAPTAPDTLRAYPSYDSDPFVLDSCPDVFFAGCQPDFGSKVIEGRDGRPVRLVSVPDFGSTGQAVLVNLRNLECQALEFAVGGL